MEFYLLLKFKPTIHLFYAQAVTAAVTTTRISLIQSTGQPARGINVKVARALHIHVSS